MPRRDGPARDAFTEFVHARSGALHRTAYLLVGRRGLAEDLVQEALVKTYVAWPRLRDVGAVEAYVRRTMTTTAISWSRRRSWDERPVDDVPERGVGSQTDGLADSDAVWAAVLGLPVRQRAALVLRFYEELSVAQTAEVMGCATGTVKSQVSAAIRTLRERLTEHHPELGDRLMTELERTGGSR